MFSRIKCSINQAMNVTLTNSSVKTFKIQMQVKLEHLVNVTADDVRILSSEFKKTKTVVSNRLVDITMKLPRLITVH